MLLHPHPRPLLPFGGAAGLLRRHFCLPCASSNEGPSCHVGVAHPRHSALWYRRLQRPHVILAQLYAHGCQVFLQTVDLLRAGDLQTSNGWSIPAPVCRRRALGAAAAAAAAAAAYRASSLTGTTSPPRASTHASASCPGVQPLAAASWRTRSTSSMFCREEREWSAAVTDAWASGICIGPVFRSQNTNRCNTVQYSILQYSTVHASGMCIGQGYTWRAGASGEMHHLVLRQDLAVRPPTLANASSLKRGIMRLHRQRVQNKCQCSRAHPRRPPPLPPPPPTALQGPSSAWWVTPPPALRMTSRTVARGGGRKGCVQHPPL